MFVPTLKLKGLVDGPSDKLDNLLGYLKENWDEIYGSRNLKSNVRAKEVLVVGGGGIEDNLVAPDHTLRCIMGTKPRLQ